MTRRTNATLAGITFLVYIAAGIGAMKLSGNAHATGLLSIVQSFSALILGVTLYSITRDVDRDLAMLAMLSRVLEAAPGPGENVFRRGQRAVRVASAARTDDSIRARLARMCRVGPACDSAAASGRRIFRRPWLVVVTGDVGRMAADVAVRGDARGVADCERRRSAECTMKRSVTINALTAA